MTAMQKVLLISHTPNPEATVAAAAKLCYSNAGADDIMAGLTPEKTDDFLAMLASIGHESPMEHASFTFCVEGVSRVLLAQLTRHRIASFSVQSQRYVRLSGEGHFQFITPPEIEQNDEARALFLQCMADDIEAYNRLADLLKVPILQRLTAEGLSPASAERAAEKAAIEDARFVLPNACETKLLLTMNARSLHNFFRQRCCRRAQWEIRALAAEMLRLAREASPALFATAGPACLSGPCAEGKMTCGQTKEVRREFAVKEDAAWAD